MNPRECERELETLAAARDGRPLDEHVIQCAVCSELAVVATAFVDDYNAAQKSAPVPTSGVVWWRVQRRLRQQTVRTVSRTVTAVQIASVALAVVIAIAVVGASQWAEWAKTFSDAVRWEPLAAMATGPLVLAVLGAWALIAPVAVWLMVDGRR